MTTNSTAAQLVPGWWKIGQMVMIVLAAGFWAWVLWVLAARTDAPHLRFWCVDIGLIVSVPWVWLTVFGAFQRWRWWPSVVLPVVLSSTMALALAGAPGAFGWAISRAAMEQLATSCDWNDAGARAGVYTIEQISYGPTSCVFDLSSDRELIRLYKDDPAIDVAFCESLGGAWYFCTKPPEVSGWIYPADSAAVPR